MALADVSASDLAGLDSIRLLGVLYMAATARRNSAETLNKQSRQLSRGTLLQHDHGCYPSLT